MSSRKLAWLAVVSTLSLTLVAVLGWNSWRRHQMEQIPLGAGRAEVIQRLGEPDASQFASPCADGAEECWSWKLIGQDYLEVCFDKAGNVVCRQSYSVWT